MKRDLIQLQTWFTDDHPRVVRMKAQIAALEEELRAKGGAEPAKEEATPQGAYSRQLKKTMNEVDGEIKVLKAEEGSLRRTIAAYQQRVENTPHREQEFQAISRDYEATRASINPC